MTEDLPGGNFRQTVFQLIAARMVVAGSTKLPDSAGWCTVWIMSEPTRNGAEEFLRKLGVSSQAQRNNSHPVKLTFVKDRTSKLPETFKKRYGDSGSSLETPPNWPGFGIPDDEADHIGAGH